MPGRSNIALHGGGQTATSGSLTQVNERYRCLWISLSEVSAHSPRPTPSQWFAAALAGRCEVVVVGLQVWRMGLVDR